ncbi:hypothetical protein ACEWY4_010410 [Coilia grayii]|uniref:Uncharacterized protein n=1 Tax=Coilia grayii TaxID=363190 RepID=A0ABD1K1U1_9TELE
MAAGKDFPHDPSSITKIQIAAKLKAVRNKYRHDVDAGRRSGHGRVVLIFFELCTEIWGGSPAMTALPSGFETGDLLDNQSTSANSPNSPSCSGLVKERRDLLQARLNNHRGDRLKRKTPTDPAVLEDLRLKQRMVEIMEEEGKKYSKNMETTSENMSELIHTIREGFALLKTMVDRQQYQMPGPAIVAYGQPGTSMYPNMHGPIPSVTPSYLHTPLHPAHTHLHVPPHLGHPLPAPFLTEELCCRRMTTRRHCKHCSSPSCMGAQTDCNIVGFLL